MRLEKLEILNYKNIRHKKFCFDKGVSCFVGDNGIGKTSVLDAIYHLCFSKSYNNPISSQNIHHEADFFMLEGEFVRQEKRDTILCSLKKGQKKTLKKNGKPYEKIAEHIGLFPAVMIAPTDRDLILLGSQIRRKFMDGVIAQKDPVYLQNTLQYQKVLTQRNALLKFFAKNQTFDAVYLDAFDMQMIAYGKEIHKKRIAFIKVFDVIFQKVYKEISAEKETIHLKYKSSLSENNFEDILKQQRQKDRILQHTSEGIHKDDLHFTIDDFPIAKYGSQGQQKTYLISLKLAQLQFLKQELGQTPLLLLDDIFDKLDEKRVCQLLEMVNSKDFHQIFITDTHADRTKKLVENLTDSHQMITM